METAVENAIRLGLLIIPAILGAFAARRGLFEDTRSAIDALNVFALYFGFPALITAGILDNRFTLPSDVGFWLAIPLIQVVLVALVPLLARAAGSKDYSGTLALTALFGNVAYLGLPLAIEVFGDEHRGTIALLVSIHVVIAVSAGPLLLMRWSGDSERSRSVSHVLKQPLLWAPFVGLAGRALPEAATLGLYQVVNPIGKAAAPVALFLLGVYLWEERRAMVSKVPSVGAHVLLKLVVSPLVAFAVVGVLFRAGHIQAIHAQIAVVLAGMPAAITTFSIAHGAGIGAERVASTIARSTVAALVTLPVLASLAGWIS